MANPYYTASPMVNFNYESKPSEAQGVLDTMKKIKKEGIEDETRQMQMLQAQQAYEMGNLKMQGAQMEMDKVKRREQIEQQSSQIYNAQLASGVPRSQAMKAVTDYRQANLDWSERQEDLEEMKKSSLEALKFADRVDPSALADAAAQFSTSFGVEVTPEQFQQMSKNRQPVTTKDGRIYEWDNAQGDYVEKTPAALAKRLDEDRKFEQEMDKEDKAIKRETLMATRENRAAMAEDRALRREDAQRARDLDMQLKQAKIDKMNTSSDKLTGMDKVNFDEAKIKLRTAGRELESARKALASGKEDQMAQLIARLGGVSTGGIEGNKQALKDLIEQRENDMKRVLLLADQSGVPAIQELVKWHDEFSSTPMTDAPANPTANPAGVASGTKTLDPGSKYGLALQNAKKRQSTGGK